MALQGIRRISAGIVQDPVINSGRPIIEGTRVFVDRIIGHLESGMSMAEICIRTGTRGYLPIKVNRVPTVASL